ncbi:MAG: hypothetical protein HGA47_12715 [Zoogloea sp.]|nr:hypothetical protein [Zoogloea sp.]
MAAVLFGLAAGAAVAAPDEIQVYEDDMNRPGEYGVELHANFVMQGPRTPSYAGELPSRHVLQVTPEFSYGITPNLEAGMYFPPIAFAPGGQSYENGMRLRLKYIAPKEEGQAFFYGLNTEFGYSSQRVSDSAWNMELRPIMGYRAGPWLVLFNPIVDLAFSQPGSGASFEPAFKVGREVAPGYRIGLEDYAALGPLQRNVVEREHAHTLFAAVDIEMGGVDVNFGIGRGFGDASDRLLAKMIIGLPF